MSNLRLRRLGQDWQAMQDLTRHTEKIRVVPHGDPPDRYVLTYLCRGLLDHGGTPVEATEFRFTMALGPDYPVEAPQITAHTPVFHPNLNGANVDVGGRAWRPAEGLTALVLHLGQMIQYHRYSLDEPMNRNAADWVRENESRLPIDPEPLLADLPGSITEPPELVVGEELRIELLAGEPRAPDVAGFVVELPEPVAEEEIQIELLDAQPRQKSEPRDDVEILILAEPQRRNPR